MATITRNSNPALNEKAFQRVTQDEAGWAASTQQLEDAFAAPAATRGPVIGTDTMTVNGTVWATAALLVLVVASGVFGWNSVDTTADSVSLPGWIFPVVLGAFGVAILTIFKPDLARFTAPTCISPATRAARRRRTSASATRSPPPSTATRAIGTNSRGCRWVGTRKC